MLKSVLIAFDSYLILPHGLIDVLFALTCFGLSAIKDLLIMDKTLGIPPKYDSDKQSSQAFNSLRALVRFGYQW